jgi:NAD(P)-dependent dehydrogenase (short-subunit alcohol dehydrogenase family)
MNSPSFLHDIGADSDPRILREVEAALPMRKLCEPEEAAHFVASLIDGKATYQTAQYFAIDGGWSLM